MSTTLAFVLLNLLLPCAMASSVELPWAEQQNQSARSKRRKDRMCRNAVRKSIINTNALVQDFTFLDRACTPVDLVHPLAANVSMAQSLKCLELKVDWVLQALCALSPSLHQGQNVVPCNASGVPASVLAKQCAASRTIQRFWRSYVSCRRQAKFNISIDRRSQCIGGWEPLPTIGKQCLMSSVAKSPHGSLLEHGVAGVATEITGVFGSSDRRQHSQSTAQRDSGHQSTQPAVEEQNRLSNDEHHGITSQDVDVDELEEEEEDEEDIPASIRMTAVKAAIVNSSNDAEEDEQGKEWQPALGSAWVPKFVHEKRFQNWLQRNASSWEVHEPVEVVLTKVEETEARVVFLTLSVWRFKTGFTNLSTDCIRRMFDKGGFHCRTDNIIYKVAWPLF